MNGTLKPGHWCRPKDENEWKAILDLAEALGIKRRFTNQRLPYHEFDCVMFYVGVYAAAYGAHDKEILPSDFIRGMYALAGQKEPCRPGVEQRLDDHEKRIKALESHTTTCIRDHQESDSRIRELETERDMRKFLKDEGRKVIMPDGVVGRIVDSSVAHITVRSDQHQPCSITIDPRASPKDIPFSVALEYMKAGRRVKRASWFILKAAYILDGGFRFDGAAGPLSFGLGDILATDWEVIPEP